MDSLYQGCPDATIVHPDYKIYGKDMLNVASPQSLFDEMKSLLSVDKCVTQAHCVTNIVNIYETIQKAHPCQLDDIEFTRLECCMRIKYPNRLHASPAFDSLGEILPHKKRTWCVIL